MAGRMIPGAAMPMFGRKPEPNEPQAEPETDDDGLSEEQIGIIANRWRNLTDSPEHGGGGFTPEQAFALCANPRLDWHFAAHLRARGCPFEQIL